jgi:hypothetical protein
MGNMKSITMLSTLDPDFDGLEFESLKNGTSFERTISSYDALRYKKYRNKELGNSSLPVDAHYDNDPPLDEATDCRRNSWISLRFPTCNSMHELTFDRPAGKKKWLQEYHYRLVG